MQVDYKANSAAKRIHEAKNQPTLTALKGKSAAEIRSHIEDLPLNMQQIRELLIEQSIVLAWLLEREEASRQ